MKNKALFISLIILCLLLSMKPLSAQVRADEILQKMDKVLYSAKDMSSTLRIVLIDKSGNKKEREAYVLQKGNFMTPV